MKHPALNKIEMQLYKEPKERNHISIESSINSILFSRFMPAYVIINQSRDIIQFKGATSNYLEHSTGKATLNIMTMARPEIAFELRDAISKAMETKTEFKKSGIELKVDSAIHTIGIDAIPILTDEEEPLLLIVFTRQQEMIWQEHPHKADKNSSIKKLQDEIAYIRAELIAESEAKEKSYKILQAVNEEILSSNEEFQSLNEEMETSKEEIESANQELITTNQELQTRNEQLAEANDLSQAIVATLHEPMLILDKHMRIKSSNKAFYKKFQMLQSEVEGKMLYELANRQWDMPKLRELLENVILRDTYFYDVEITHTFAEIGKRTMLLNAMRIVQQVDNEQLILLAFTDTTEKTLERKAEKKELEDIITERTKALAQSYQVLEEKNLSLEKMNKDLETFTFISSHDLQEPLRKITNFANCLEVEEKNISTSGKLYLTRMQESVKRMQRLIEDLLTYSRMKTNSDKFELTDLNSMTKDVLSDFKDNIKETKAKVTVQGLGKVSLIRFQIRQLLYNLISNSLKFSHSKRPLHIDIKGVIATGKKLKKAELTTDLKYCHITFSDNGIGFDPQYKERIFEVFQRLHQYDDYKGTGIGLAICKRIIENHQGLMTATGRPDKGAQFDLYIPMAQTH